MPTMLPGTAARMDARIASKQLLGTSRAMAHLSTKFSMPHTASNVHYQGGSSFTVFSAQGSNPLANCKLSGKAGTKVYDKSVKGFVYVCNGGPSSKIQLPKEENKSGQGLQLIHPNLVLQLFVPKGQHFSLELRVSDSTSARRKMYFSTSFSELKITPLHCQIPMSMVVHDQWLSLSINVADLFFTCFPVMEFRSIDVIILGAVCKLRKIFTMRSRLAETAIRNEVCLGIDECLPTEHMFASGVESCIQVIDTAKLHSALGIAVPGSDGGKHNSIPDSAFTTRRLTLNKVDLPRHVAFDSRMSLSPAVVNASSERRSIKERRALNGNGNISQSMQNSKPIEVADITELSDIAEQKGPQYKEDNMDTLFDCLPDCNIVNEPLKGLHTARDYCSAGSTKVTTRKEGSPVLIPCQMLRKKKEEVNFKQETHLSSSRHPRKERSNAIVKAKETQVEDSPPDTPCGWEQCTSMTTGYDDMSFIVHTSLDKFGEDVESNIDAHLFSSNCNDAFVSKDLANQSKRYSFTGPVSFIEEKNKEMERKEKKYEGLEFYQLEIEKDFMYGTSDSDDDLEDHRSSSSEAISQNMYRFTTVCKESSTGDPATCCQSSRGNLEDEFLVETEVNTHALDVVHEQVMISEILLDSGQPTTVPMEDTTWGVDADSRDNQGCLKHQDQTPELHGLQPSVVSQWDQLAKSNAPVEHDTRFEEKIGNLEDDLDLLYDPTLDCYYDPKTNRYYELK